MMFFRTLRKILHGGYALAGMAAACSIVGIMALIIAKMVARWFHLYIPSADEFVGFGVIWASFLGLAYTMHHQNHIRVELLLSRLKGKNRRRLDIFSGFLATIILGLLTYYIITMIVSSYEFEDVTDGQIPLPLWLMQLPVGIGVGLFTLSMLDFTVCRIVDHRVERR